MRIFLSMLVMFMAAAVSAVPPNIVFIFSDDHALQAMGAYPSWLHEFVEQQNITPNIDRLAKEGAVFANSFCANSICSPSRACVLTGKHSHLNGVTRWQKFDGKQTTFPKLLQKAGYQTALIGKWHLISEPTGFDFWRVLPGQGVYYNPEFITPTGKQRTKGYVTEIITDMALDWLEKQRDAAKPFVLMIQHKAPHRNWGPAPQYAHWLDDVKIPEPPTLFDDYSGRTPSASKQAMEIGRHMTLKSDLKTDPEEFKKLGLTGKDVVRWKYQRYMQDYLRCVKSVDDSVGRVREYLKKAGLDKNTIVIYSSDQGFYLGEHGWFDKRWMYEESFRMPLIVNWPGVTKPGARPTELVQNIDYAPTFLDIAGVPVPEEMQGMSLVPLLKGETPKDWRTDLYYHYYDGPEGEHRVAPHEGVRTARYTLINFYKTGDWELFDLEKDPQEMHSVYGDPAYAKVLAEMKQRLAGARERYKLPPLSQAEKPPDKAEGVE